MKSTFLDSKSLFVTVCRDRVELVSLARVMVTRINREKVNKTRRGTMKSFFVGDNVMERSNGSA